MEKYFLFAIVVIVINLTAQAQTGNTKIITGKIVDEKRLPVPYATVALKTKGRFSFLQNSYW